MVGYEHIQRRAAEGNPTLLGMARGRAKHGTRDQRLLPNAVFASNSTEDDSTLDRSAHMRSFHGGTETHSRE